MLPGEDGRYRPRDDAEKAMACVDAADTALRLVVETAAEGRRRWTRRFYKAYTTDTGPAALVLMGLGLAAIDARLRTEGVAKQRQLEARRVLTNTFGQDDQADHLLNTLSGQIDPETGEGLAEASVELALAVSRGGHGRPGGVDAPLRRLRRRRSRRRV